MKRFHNNLHILIGIVLLATLVLSACGGANQKKMYTIGVANLAKAFEPILDGFKAGMEAAGFKEGVNVTYLYDGPAANPDALVTVLETLKAQNVDLILTFGTTATLKAKTALEGTNIPVIFGPVTDPVASGIVPDLLKPGGNITGIRTGNPTPKRLEWLAAIVPGLQQVYVFNNPKDSSSVQALAALQETAPLFHVTLEVCDATTADEVSAGLNAIPSEADAIFILASAFFESQIDLFVQAANEHHLPLAAPATANVWSGALTSWGHDNVPLGQQAARLAVQILNGVKPADLPIESADLFLSINLKTATTIDLNIPNNILQQADILVR